MTIDPSAPTIADYKHSLMLCSMEYQQLTALQKAVMAADLMRDQETDPLSTPDYLRNIGAGNLAKYADGIIEDGRRFRAKAEAKRAAETQQTGVILD